jgi:hypothetical protein
MAKSDEKAFGKKPKNKPAFAVPHDLGFRLVERWQFNLVQVIKAVR